MAKKSTHITRRSGSKNWQYRRRVPAHAQDRLGAMWTRSLDTDNFDVALERRKAVAAEFDRLVHQRIDPVRAKLESAHGIPVTQSDEQAATTLSLLGLAIKADSDLPTTTIKLTIDLPVDADDRVRAAAVQRAEEKFWAEQFSPLMEIDDRDPDELATLNESHLLAQAPFERRQYGGGSC